ncbi:MAG: beta-propeller domain-containing protein [Acholeplasmatales bacterium]
MFDALIVMGIILVVLTIPFIIRLVWNIRLMRFQKRNFIKPTTNQKLSLSNNLVATTLLLAVGLFSIVGGSIRPNNGPKDAPIPITFEDYMTNDKLHENAKVFSSKEEFNNIFKDINSNYSNLFISRGESGFLDYDSVVAAPLASDSSKNLTGDTYEQVSGVSEGDIAKFTDDQKHIIYVNKAKQALHKISLNDSGEVIGTLSVKLDSKFYFQDMFLHDDKIVLFSYANQRIIYTPYFLDIDFPIYCNHGTTNYFIYNISDLEMVKKGELLGHYREVRKVDNVLYVATNDYVNGNVDDERFFENVYYFKGRFNSHAITRLYAISLETNEIISHIGFVGSLDSFYMGNGKIVLTNIRWNYSEEESLYYNESNVIVVNYYLGQLKYAGSAVVEGMALEQYYIDVRDGYIRVVTTFGRNNSNALYIFKEDQETDKLELVSLLNDDLGKPNESVKSVTYTDTQVKIVTFFQRDPLYTIDISNPTKPKIVSVIEEPGFSSSLIVWDEDLGFTIGIGVMADNNGRATGVKISAYNEVDASPIQTIEFNYQKYGYFWVRALYEQRTNLLVSKEKGVIAFIGQGFRNGETKVLLFNIDFNRKTPIVLNEVLFEKSFDYNIDKLVLFNENVHILGRDGVYTFNTDTSTLSKHVKFELEKEIPYNVSYNDDGYFGEILMYEYEGRQYTRKNLQVMITSKEELLALADEWKNQAFNETSSEYNNALNQILRLYDEEYFQTKNLIIYTHNYYYYEINVGNVTVNNLEVIVNLNTIYNRCETQYNARTIVIEVNKDDTADLSLVINHQYK